MTKQDTVIDHRAHFERGLRTFSLLFTRWMDTNGWSHPTMVTLAKASMHGVGWLHSSQISGLRHAKLESPGPRTFIAIERLNYYVHRYSTTKRLIPGTDSSNLYQEAFAITEDSKPPSLGWWVEVFCGQREPQDIDLRQLFFSERQADEMSSSWASMIRKLFRDKDLDLIVELDRVLREHYPARDAGRLDRIRAVIQARESWTPDEFATELPAISALTAHLGGPETEDELLDHLRQSKAA
ncbi:MAG: hypothetical protein ACO3PY_05785 [Pontimonas sp.]